MSLEIQYPTETEKVLKILNGYDYKTISDILFQADKIASRNSIFKVKK